MANHLLDAALAYAERGMAVLPCRADKTPYTSNGVSDATTDPARIQSWWASWPRANIGFHPHSSDMLVVDIDPGADMRQLEASWGHMPETLMRARTPRGGEHLFFSLKPGEVVSLSASKVAPNVDIRSFQSYVLLAPSATKDGSYTWESEGKPAFRTDDMVRVANSHREKSGDRDKWLIEPDLPENIAAAVRWLQTDAKVAVEGQGGDAMAYATAAHLKSYGISQALAFDLIWQYWNPRCVPPWSADEVDHLETKVVNGYSYNTSPPGNITPAYAVARQAELFKPVEIELEKPGRSFKTGRFRFVDWGGMDSIAEPEWLIKGMIPQDAYAIMFGAPGTFKSFLAIDLAMHVATGAATFPWDGSYAAEDISQGNVLFALGEGRSNFPKRTRAWAQRYWAGDEVPGLVLTDPVPHAASKDDLGLFIDGALEMRPEGYKMVVIDTVTRAMSGMNKNDDMDATRFTAMVDTLRMELGCTVLAIMHTGRGDTSREAGSMAFRGDADTIVAVERVGKSNLVHVRVDKQKDGEEWEQPRRFELFEHDLGGDKKTLVVGKAAPIKPGETLVVPPAGVKFKPVVTAAQSEAETMMLELVAKAVSVTLKANIAKEWSTAVLARTLALRPELSMGEAALRARYLPELRAHKTVTYQGSYDGLRDRWRAGA